MKKQNVSKKGGRRRKRFRYRTDYFANSISAVVTTGGACPFFFEQKDPMTHMASFCDDKTLGVAGSLSHYHRFVFSCNEAWAHLPHDPKDGARQTAGYLDLPHEWNTWPPYALPLPTKTPTKYKRAYYVAVKLGLRPSLSESCEQRQADLKWMEGQLKKLTKQQDKNESRRVFWQASADYANDYLRGGFALNSENNYVMYVERLRTALRRLLTLRKRVQLCENLQHIYEKQHVDVSHILSVLLERKRKTEVFAVFLKEGVWSFYDIWDEESAYEGHAMLTVVEGGLVYPPRQQMMRRGVGDSSSQVDWRLRHFDLHDTAVGQCPATPHFPCATCGGNCINLL